MCLVCFNKTVNIVHTTRLVVVLGHILTPLQCIANYLFSLTFTTWCLLIAHRPHAANAIYKPNLANVDENK